MKTCQSRLLISLYKVENKKEKIADFKTAISSTVRSLSNSEKIEVSFGNESSKSKKNLIRLPELSPINNKLNYNQIRAIADSKSLRHRFSDPKTFKQYEPEGNISKKLYGISEKITGAQLQPAHSFSQRANPASAQTQLAQHVRVSI